MMPIPPSLRSVAWSAITSTWFLRGLRATRQRGCLVLCLHRFTYGDASHVGHDPEGLRHLLETLRKHRIGIVDAELAAQRIELDVDPPEEERLSVAFTVDDGYADLVSVAEPIFAEYDCPVTAFVVPAAVEQRTWFWWDRLDWVLRYSSKRSLEVEVEGGWLRLAWHDESSRLVARTEAEAALKRCAHSQLEDMLDRMAEAASVAIPRVAPADYRVLDWEEIRSAERRGMRFGAHSLTHPILSRCTDERAEQEIRRSVEGVRANLGNPANIFCYPNGSEGDFGSREFKAIRQSNIEYAYTTIPGVLRLGREAKQDANWRFRLPRAAYSDQFAHIVRSFLT